MDGLIREYVDGVHLDNYLIRRKNFRNLCNKVAINWWDVTHHHLALPYYWRFFNTRLCHTETLSESRLIRRGKLVKLNESFYYCHHILLRLWGSWKDSRGPTSDCAWSKRVLHVLYLFLRQDTTSGKHDIVERSRRLPVLFRVLCLDLVQISWAC